MTGGSWTKDWRELILAACHQAGYASLCDFASAHRTLTYKQLIERLSCDAAPVQLQSLIIEEAERDSQLDEYARDCLARLLRQKLGDTGWHESKEDAVIRALSSFAGIFGPGFERMSKLLWDRIQNSEIPIGWLPTGPWDPLLMSIFEGLRVDDYSHDQ